MAWGGGGDPLNTQCRHQIQICGSEIGKAEYESLMCGFNIIVVKIKL